MISTKDIGEARVFGGPDGSRRIGKVRNFVFHPTQKRCLGIIVKRPDLLWMFKRKDAFVPVGQFALEDGHVCVAENGETTGREAAKRYGFDWDKSVFWLGLPIMVEEGSTVGRVGIVTFDDKTGEVLTVSSDSGATANVLLGRREIPADLIKGFRLGIGEDLAQRGRQDDDEAQDESGVLRGALLVDAKVLAIETEDGLAEKAGKTTAIVADKASKATAAAGEKASIAAKKTGEVVNKGAYAAGEQIGKSKGMFSAFKAEYDKARRDDEE